MMTITEKITLDTIWKYLQKLACEADGTDDDWTECIVREILKGAAQNYEPKIIRYVNEDEAEYNAHSKYGYWVEFTPKYRCAVQWCYALNYMLDFATTLREQAATQPAFKTILAEYAETV